MSLNLMQGISQAGEIVTLTLNEDGTMIGNSSSGPGGPGGDASAFNQETQTTRLNSILGRLPTLLSDGKFAVVDAASLAELTTAVSRLTSLVTNSVALLANQATEIAGVEAVRDRLPATLTTGKLAVTDSQVASVVTALGNVLDVSDAQGLLKLTDIATALIGILNVDDLGVNTKLVTIQNSLDAGVKVLNTPTIIPFEDTFTNLAANATFTGATRTTEGFASFRTGINTNVAGTAFMEQSSNGTLWRRTQQQIVSASTPTAVGFLIIAPFCRVVYVNGGSAQTSFSLISALTS